MFARRRSSRLRLVILAVLGGVALVLAGCAGSKESKQDVVTARGRVSNRGSTPFSLVMFETTDGRSYVLQSSAIVEELARLEGMDVEVTGIVRPDLEGDTPLFVAEDYDLLPLSSGERPVIGVINVTSNGIDRYVVLVDRNDVRWIVEGTFAEVLAGFEGSKVWIAGVVKSNVTHGGGTFKMLEVSEYGVIRRP